MAPPPVNPIVDELLSHFPELRVIRQQASAEFVANLIRLYCTEGVRVLDDLSRILASPTLQQFDPGYVDAVVHQLKGSSASIGVRKVKDACDELRAFIKQNDRDGSLQKLNTAKIHFYEARGMFQILLQHLDREIQASQPPK